MSNNGVFSSSDSFTDNEVNSGEKWKVSLSVVYKQACQQKQEQRSQGGEMVLSDWWWFWAAQCILCLGCDALSRAMKRAQCTWVRISESSSASDWQQKRRNRRESETRRKITLLKTEKWGEEETSDKEWQAEREERVKRVSKWKKKTKKNETHFLNLSPICPVNDHIHIMSIQH